MNLPEPRQDQWAAQIQGRIQLKADVYFYSHNFTEAQLREALLEPCRDIPETVAMLRERYGRDARVCVLPEGPQTIPFYAPGTEAPAV